MHQEIVPKLRIGLGTSTHCVVSDGKRNKQMAC